MAVTANGFSRFVVRSGVGLIEKDGSAVIEMGPAHFVSCVGRFIDY